MKEFGPFEKCSEASQAAKDYAKANGLGGSILVRDANEKKGEPAGTAFALFVPHA